MRTILALALILGVAGCGKREPGPNVLLITLDTTRADHIGCYGYDRAQTPTLDRLAEEGVRFENAVCHTPLTLPSHATMFTGLLPPEHGLRINGEHALSDDVETLAERLKQRGYTTAAFPAAVVLDHKYNLDQGFDVYDDAIQYYDPAAHGLRAYRPGDRVVDRFLEWFESKKDAPFFCWVHFFDPHKPYHSHEALFGATYRDQPYDAEIAFMDRQIQRMMDALDTSGQADETIVLLVGDHGEGLGDHHELYHGNTLYQSTLHVPLIVYGSPMNRSAAVIDDVFGLRYIPALIDTLLNGQPPEAVYQQTEEALYLETLEPYKQYGWAPLYGVIDGAWKYIEAPKPELYHWMNDPGEQTNQMDQNPDIAVTLRTKRAQMTTDFQRQKPQTVQLSASEQRQLESLGYVGSAGTATLPEDFGDLPDVKDRLPFLMRMMTAKALMNRDKQNEAHDLLRELEAEDPGNLTLQQLCAENDFRRGQWASAIDRVTHFLTQEGERLTPPMQVDALSLKARCLYAQGHRQEARKHLRAALAIQPRHDVSLNGLAWILATDPNSRTQEWEEAVRMAKQAAFTSGYSNPAYLDTYAAALARVGDFGEAVRRAEQAIEAARRFRQPQLARQIEQRLKQYRAGRVYIGGESFDGLRVE